MDQLADGPQDDALLGSRRQLGVRRGGPQRHEEARGADQRADDRGAHRLQRPVHAVRVEGAAQELHPARVPHGERFRPGESRGHPPRTDRRAPAPPEIP